MDADPQYHVYEETDRMSEPAPLENAALATEAQEAGAEEIDGQ